MPEYTFARLNHLGEMIDVASAAFEDESDARMHAAMLAGQGYRIALSQGHLQIGVIEPPRFEVENWLKPYLGSYPLDP